MLKRDVAVLMCLQGFLFHSSLTYKIILLLLLNNLLHESAKPGLIHIIIIIFKMNE